MLVYSRLIQRMSDSFLNLSVERFVISCYISIDAPILEIKYLCYRIFFLP